MKYVHRIIDFWNNLFITFLKILNSIEVIRLYLDFEYLRLSSIDSSLFIEFLLSIAFYKKKLHLKIFHSFVQKQWPSLFIHPLIYIYIYKELTKLHYRILLFKNALFYRLLYHTKLINYYNNYIADTFRIRKNYSLRYPFHNSGNRCRPTIIISRSQLIDEEKLEREGSSSRSISNAIDRTLVKPVIRRRA